MSISLAESNSSTPDLLVDKDDLAVSGTCTIFRSFSSWHHTKALALPEALDREPALLESG